MKILDRAGVFSAIQLGEWGYYFHNLANNESWWREVFGRDAVALKHGELALTAGKNRIELVPLPERGEA